MTTFICCGIPLALALLVLAAHIAGRDPNPRNTHLEPDIEYHGIGTNKMVQVEDWDVEMGRGCALFALIILATAVLTLLFQGAG